MSRLEFAAFVIGCVFLLVGYCVRLIARHAAKLEEIEREDARMRDMHRHADKLPPERDPVTHPKRGWGK